MAKLIECIPNFSCSKEKDEATYNALVETAKSVPGCTLFDAQTDGNHNRCVFTLIGSPEAIEEVAFQLTKVATERIDMNKHHGEHKRMGATDVIPFVPQMDVTVEEAVEMSKRVAQRIWDELKVPSFLYEDSATRPERRNLATSSEASAYKTGIDTLSYKTPGCHDYKNTKIINGCLCQFIPVEVQYHRADCQNNGTSDETYDNCYSQHTFPIFSGCVLVIFTKLLADNDGSSIGKAATGDGTNVYHHNSNGICGNHIIANVAKDRCER